MSPPPETVPTKPADEESQIKSRKTGSSPAALKCPRCDSPNTKFCYYNNYSLTQPRHFCKSCRRYWTKGGALRNVPIGGGCRKTKKTKSSSRLSGCTDSSNTDYPFQYGFFSTPSSSSMEFHDQLGRIPFSRLNSSTTTTSPGIVYNHELVSFGDLSTSTTNTTTNSWFDHIDATSASSLLMSSFNYNPPGSSSVLNGGGVALINHHGQDMCSSSAMNNIAQSTHINLASSIESLSCINQELHWKLQQQRLAMIFGGDGGATSISGGGDNLNVNIENQRLQKEQNPLPIYFQNLEISKQEEAACGAVGNINSARKSDGDNVDTYHQFGYKQAPAANEWIFNNSTTNYTPNITSTTPYNSSINDNIINSSWKGIQAWTDLDH